MHQQKMLFTDGARDGPRGNRFAADLFRPRTLATADGGMSSGSDSDASSTSHPLVGEFAEDTARDLQRECGFSDAARPCQGGDMIGGHKRSRSRSPLPPPGQWGGSRQPGNAGFPRFTAEAEPPRAAWLSFRLLMPDRPTAEQAITLGLTSVFSKFRYGPSALRTPPHAHVARFLRLSRPARCTH